jgi:hypothetical protein
MLGGGAGSASAGALPFAPSASIGITVLAGAAMTACFYLLSRRRHGDTLGRSRAAARRRTA